MRNYKLYIDDIIKSIEKIMAYTKNYSYSQFIEDSKTYESVLLNLFVIGEAANKIPDDIQEKYPVIDWRGITGMRNVIAHGYFNIKPDIVWKTVQDDIPGLLLMIKEIK